MAAVTRILKAVDQGDGEAAEQRLPLVYQELRKLAAAKLQLIITAEEQEAKAATLRSGTINGVGQKIFRDGGTRRCRERETV